MNRKEANHEFALVIRARTRAALYANFISGHTRRKLFRFQSANQLKPAKWIQLECEVAAINNNNNSSSGGGGGRSNINYKKKKQEGKRKGNRKEKEGKRRIEKEIDIEPCFTLLKCPV